MNERSWDARCSEILQRMAGHYHDHEIAASIEAETGKRFMPRTVAEYRRVAGLAPCRKNDWTAALKMWRAREVPDQSTDWPEGMAKSSVIIPASPKIEISQEMIEAGVAAFYDWDDRVEEPEGLVIQIFEAMETKKPTTA